MGESWGDLTAGEYMFSHGYSTGANPWVVGPYATGNKVGGHPRLPDRQEPAELLRLRLRQHRRRGARRRRDLERHPVVGPPGAGQQVEREVPLQPTRRCSCRCAEAGRPARRCRPSRCPGNRRWIQLVFDAFLLQQGATIDAGRARRDARRRPDALRRPGPDGDVERLRPPRHGQGRLDARTPTRASPTPELRLAAGPQRRRVRVHGPPAPAGSSSAATRPASPRSPTRCRRTKLGRHVVQAGAGPLPDAVRLHGPAASPGSR